MSEFISSILISTEDFRQYGASEHVENLNKLLLSIENKVRSSVKLSLQQTIKVRNHLMVTITYLNALRVSNLLNTSLKEVNSAKEDKELPGAYVFNNKNTKLQ